MNYHALGVLPPGVEVLDGGGLTSARDSGKLRSTLKIHRKGPTMHNQSASGAQTDLHGMSDMARLAILADLVEHEVLPALVQAYEQIQNLPAANFASEVLNFGMPKPVADWHHSTGNLIQAHAPYLMGRWTRLPGPQAMTDALRKRSKGPDSSPGALHSAALDDLAAHYTFLVGHVVKRDNPLSDMSVALR